MSMQLFHLITERSRRLAGVLFSALALTSAGGAWGHGDDPLGVKTLPWKADNIKRTIGYYLDDHAGLVEAFGTTSRVTERASRQCLTGAIFGFDVDDKFAFDIDEPVTLELVFDRTDTDGFMVSYDHASDPFPYQDFDLPDGDGRWVTMEVVLDRARFVGRGYEGTDFVIASLGSKFFHLGEKNIDLTLCDLKIRRAEGAGTDRGAADTGVFKLTVGDAETGAALAARVGLYDATGKMPLPSDAAVSIERYRAHFKQVPMRPDQERWPSKGRYIFYVDSDYLAELPVGDYELVVARGPEYHLDHKTVKIEKGRVTDVDVRLKRWTHMAEQDWYSGDAHIHLSREERDNERIAVPMQAEDLNVANLLQMSTPDRYYFDQYAFGDAGRYIDGRFILSAGQESPRTGHRGHTISLNAQQYHHPDPYYAYHLVAEKVQREGGMFGYAHVALEAFHLDRGLALDVPLGSVDFVEILQLGMLDVDKVYEFWNLGFKLIPTAGSDYPYINLPGTERNYVHVEGDYSPAAFFDAWKQNRTFVTNGPMLDFTVNGASMGAELSVEKGDTLKIAAAARVNPDYDKLERLELVVHGEVVVAVKPEGGAQELVLYHELVAGEGMWLAVTAYGERGGLAHTAPVYVYTDDEKTFWKADAVPGLIDKQKALIKTLIENEPRLDEENEYSIPMEDYGKKMQDEWRKSLGPLQERAAQAMHKYDEMLEKLGASKD